MDLTRLGIAGAPSVEISDLAYDTRSVTGTVWRGLPQLPAQLP